MRYVQLEVYFEDGEPPNLTVRLPATLSGQAVELNVQALLKTVRSLLSLVAMDSARGKIRTSSSLFTREMTSTSSGITVRMTPRYYGLTVLKAKWMKTLSSC